MSFVSRPIPGPEFSNPWPGCRALTREEAARVEQLAGALALQFVGLSAVRGKRAVHYQCLISREISDCQLLDQNLSAG